MKKVFLNGRFLTQKITGVQRTAYELVLALDHLIDKENINKNDYNFQLIYSGQIINPISLKNINIVNKGFFKGNLWEQIELPFYTFGDLLVSMGSMSSIIKRKQILIVHDASPMVNASYFPLIFRMWYRFAITLLGKMAMRTVTVSNFSKSELIKYVGFSDRKTTVIYNAANHILRFKEPEQKFTEKINNLKPYCLGVSSLGANKNFSGLSKAISKIDFKQYHMLVAGGAMSTLQQTKSESSVIYLGYVTNEQLKYLYANASLFIFPSFYEGFGIPPLEAMISGCPVLSSNTSAMPEVLKDASAYCDPSNVDDIASMIELLINDNFQLKKLRDKGYKRAAVYNWESSAKSLLNLIKTFY